LDQSKDQLKSILNALKNGVVPERISSLRVGRDEEIKEFEDIFEHVLTGNGTTKFIVGEYGSGKSFMLREIQERAWEQNFVVARIQLEKGLRLNNFQTLYYQIMHSLTTSDSEHNGTSFQDLFNNWIETLKKKSTEGNSADSIQQVISILNQYNLSFSRALLFYIRARIQNDTNMADAVTSWLTGEQNIPSSVKKNFEVVGHIDHDNAVHFLKAFVKLIKLLGYSGLVILIDELELVMSERSDVRMQAYQNLRYIIDNCYNEQLSHCLFVFGATKEWLHNEEKGPQIYPALYQRIGKGNDSAVTGDTDVRQPIVILSKMTTAEMQKLTQNVMEMYKYAYDFKLEINPQSLQKWMTIQFKEEGMELQDVSIRLYLKKLMEVLDIMEQNPDSQVIKTMTDSKNAFVQKVLSWFNGSKRTS
jgi:hypothetical protein